MRHYDLIQHEMLRKWCVQDNVVNLISMFLQEKKDKIAININQQVLYFISSFININFILA